MAQMPIVSAASWDSIPVKIKEVSGKKPLEILREERFLKQLSLSWSLQKQEQNVQKKHETPSPQTEEPKPAAPIESPMPEDAEYEEVTLMATAYYSPLPNQRYYLRNSLREELILNGNGTHGASGKPVFNGMLAAPKTYNFGTKIWVEWFGIGSVEDRGGAIVPAGMRGNAHDRIDIWMGHGEEWLARALAWGRRPVKARIYTSRKVAITFDFTKVPPANLSKSIAKAVKLPPVTTESSSSVTTENSAPAVKTSAPVVTESSTPAKITMSALAPKKPDELDAKLQEFEKEKLRVQSLIEELGTPKIWDVSPKIRMLQEILIEMWFLNTKSTAIYGPSTKAAVAAFQKSAWLIIESNDPHAGVLGTLTRKKLVEEILYRGIEV